MARGYGRCLKASAVVAAVAHGRWTTATFVAGLRHDRIDASCMTDAATSSEDTIGLPLDAF